MLAARRKVARLDGDVLELTSGRRTTRIPLARIREVSEEPAKALSVRLDDGTVHLLPGPGETAVANFSAALRARLTDAGDLTPAVPEARTTWRKVPAKRIAAWGFAVFLVALALTGLAVGAGTALVPLGITSWVLPLGWKMLRGGVQIFRGPPRHWPVVTATVVETEDDDPWCTVVYPIAGGVTERSRVRAPVTDRWTGSHCEVAYDPHDPGTASRLPTAGDRAVGATLLAVAALFVLAALAPVAIAIREITRAAG